MSMFVVIVCFVAVSMSESSANGALRILDGRDAEPGEYPFVVRIEKLAKMFLENNINIESELRPRLTCTGTAVSATWTLTARHCVDSFKEIKYFRNYYLKFRLMVRYGFSQGEINANGSASAIIKCEYLPDKKDRTLARDDVAICYTEPVLIEKYAKISAVHYATLYGLEVSVAGFGFMRESASTLNNTLNLGKPLQVLEKGVLRSCKGKEDGCSFPSMRLFPACVSQSQTFYYGDSGGSIFHASGIIGVVSRGHSFLAWKKLQHSRNYLKTSGIITPISVYINWIANVIRNT